MTVCSRHNHIYLKTLSEHNSHGGEGGGLAKMVAGYKSCSKRSGAL